MLLGHPQADVRRAGHQARLRQSGAQRDELGERARRVKLAGGAGVRQGRVLREGGQALRDGRLVGRHPGAGGHGAGGVDDRPVAGAAAQVAAQRIGCLAARHGALAALALVLVQRVQAHHEARRAEAALRAVRIDQRLLHRVQRAAGAAQLIDRDELLAVERADEGDAAIDGAPAQAARAGLTHHHGAGAAVALGAALLGALEPALLAQPLLSRRSSRSHSSTVRVGGTASSATGSSLSQKRIGRVGTAGTACMGASAEQTVVACGPHRRDRSRHRRSLESEKLKLQHDDQEEQEQRRDTVAQRADQQPREEQSGQQHQRHELDAPPCRVVLHWAGGLLRDGHACGGPDQAQIGIQRISEAVPPVETGNMVVTRSPQQTVGSLFGQRKPQPVRAHEVQLPR